jgi:hypothetical protein
MFKDCFTFSSNVRAVFQKSLAKLEHCREARGPVTLSKSATERTMAVDAASLRRSLYGLDTLCLDDVESKATLAGTRIKISRAFPVRRG